jgi:hypothetical protein
MHTKGQVIPMRPTIVCVCVHASMTQRNSLTSSEPNEHLISCKFRSS